MNVLITGAGGSLGRACVKKYVEEGCQVIALLSPGKRNIFENQPSVSVYHVDLSDEINTNEVLQTIIETHNQINAGLILVGGYAGGSIKESSGREIQKMIDLNFYTAYFISKQLFAHMASQKEGGRLVFVGSKPSIEGKGGKNAVGYTLSKSLVFKLAELLNEEGNNQEVVASVVVPSTIDTEDNRKSMPKADPSRWVKPEEIARVIYFATSNEGHKLRDPILKVYGDA